MNWAEIRGQVVDTVTGDQARRHLHRLHQRYEGAQPRDYAI